MERQWWSSPISFPLCEDARQVIDVVGGVDREAEHHPALVMLRDVAVRHPATGIGDVEQHIDDLAGGDEDCVLPDKIRLRGSIAGEDEEAARAVDVKGMVHWMVGVHLVDE